jgi:hypothetical protein
VLLSLLFCGWITPANSDSQDSFPASEFQLKHHLAGSRTGDRRVYDLACKRCMWAGLTSGAEFKYVTEWLKAHPKAIVVPKFVATVTLGSRSVEWVHVWIEDGNQSVNVSMVRDGIIPKSAMIEKNLGPDAPAGQRLVSDATYEALIIKLTLAEIAARKEKLGIWSDEMRAEREAEIIGGDSVLND